MLFDPSTELSLRDRALLEDCVAEPMCNGDNLTDADIPDLPGPMGDNNSESFLRSIVPPYVPNS